MQRYFFLLPLLALAFACSTGCDETAGPEASISGPTQLLAYADDGVIGLQWRASTSEYQSNFRGYLIAAAAKNDTARVALEVPKGTTSVRLTGLTNGTRYTIAMHAVSTSGALSKDSAVIEWSPAERKTADTLGAVIRVYASTSALPSAVDVRTDSGRTELLALGSAAFVVRADLYVEAIAPATPFLSITSPSQYAPAPGPTTEFSNVPAVRADSLNAAYATSTPSASTYTLSSIVVPDGYSSTGLIYYGRVRRGTDSYYFRVLVKRGSDGNLVQGFSIDRYLEFAFSYQGTANVPYMKPAAGPRP